MTEFGWRPVIEDGNVIALTGADGTISLEPAGQLELSGAALENLHETCAESRPPPRAGQGGRRQARARLPRPRHVARQDPHRPADHAQGPLRDHAQLHAQGRQARARHDAPHLHHPDQPRLFERGRHGEEIPRRAGAPAGGDRACSPIRRSPRASPTATRASAATSGRTPTPTAPECCRSCSRMASATSAICDYIARRADVFRVPRRQIHRRRGQELPRFPRRPARCPAGREADA